MNCANCETPINLPLSITEFVLSEHLCKDCQKDVSTLRLVVTRESPDKPWKLESSQPLRMTFNVG